MLLNATRNKIQKKTLNDANEKTYKAVDDVVVVMTRYDVRCDVIRPRGQTLQLNACIQQCTTSL